MREYARQQGPAPGDDPRAGADAAPLEPVARPGDAGLRPGRARAGRGPARTRPSSATRRPSSSSRSGRGAFTEAIARALVNEDHEFAATRWSDALSSGPGQRSFGGAAVGSRLVDSRVARVPLPPEAGLRARSSASAGARAGTTATRLWRLRGLLDLPFGGAGTRRGRRDPVHLLPGDTVDFWRVEAIEPNRLLRLAAEMSLPGRAWLQFEVEPSPGGSIIRQTAIFDPVGLLGRLYWYSIWPIHGFVFNGMIRGIARAAGDQRADMTDDDGEDMTTSPESGLADRLVRWMADNRTGLDAMMVEEGSRAIHEEFLLAEGGTLPDRVHPHRAGTRQRAPAPGCATWAMPSPRSGRAPSPDLPERMTRWNADHRRAARGPRARGAGRPGAPRRIGRPPRRSARRGAGRPLPPVRRDARLARRSP